MEPPETVPALFKLRPFQKSRARIGKLINGNFNYQERSLPIIYWSHKTSPESLKLETWSLFGTPWPVNKPLRPFILPIGLTFINLLAKSTPPELQLRLTANRPFPKNYFEQVLRPPRDIDTLLSLKKSQQEVNLLMYHPTTSRISLERP